MRRPAAHSPCVCPVSDNVSTTLLLTATTYTHVIQDSSGKFATACCSTVPARFAALQPRPQATVSLSMPFAWQGGCVCMETWHGKQHLHDA